METWEIVAIVLGGAYLIALGMSFIIYWNKPQPENL